MSLIDHILARLTPYDCLGCGLEGSLLCKECKARIPLASDRCYRCYKASSDSLTCNGCATPNFPTSVKTATLYKGVAKAMLWKLKSGGAQAAAQEMACLLLPLIGAKDGTLVVHLPTATTRIRQRGYDQARLLARALAKQSRLPYASVLSRSGQAHQVGASRAERLRQLENAFRVSRPRQVRGARVLLVDDVLTTGASFEAATKVLLAAGAVRVDAIAFARA